MNKQLLLLLALLCLSISPMAAQPKEQTSPSCPQKKEQQERRHQEFEAIRLRKIAYLTDQIQLSAEEAQLFWPIYNKMSEEKNKVNMTRRQAQYKLHLFFKGKNTLTPEEIAQYKDAYLRSFGEEYDIRVKYDTALREVLSTEKIARFYVADERFNDMIIREFITKRHPNATPSDGKTHSDSDAR